MKKQADTNETPATLTLDEQVRRAMEARGMVAEGADRGLRITRRQTCNLHRPSRHELEREARATTVRTFHG